MFANILQPSILSIFSSTGSHPLQLFSQKTDPGLPEDSFIHLLNDSSNEPSPATSRKLIQSVSNIAVDDGDHAQILRQKNLCQTVLHIQSPTIHSTYIRCPSYESNITSLGIKHPWIHLQVRDLEHEWAFEVGVVDAVQQRGVLRFCTFQKETIVKRDHGVPLLVVPMRFPTDESNQLTSWTTVSIDLSAIMKLFQSANYDNSTGQYPLPAPHYASTEYLKIYANCRIRRVWFSKTKTETLPWEFQLFGAKPDLR